MGSALAAGWLAEKTMAADQLWVLDPAPSEAARALSADGVHLIHAAADLPSSEFDVVVIAVKPQIANEVLAGLTAVFAGEPLVLSVAAGRTIAWIQGVIGVPVPVVRAMPNTPALIRQGVSVLCASPQVSRDQLAQAQHLAQAVGSVHIIDDEALMDAVTAVSGSGPAYVFLLIEAMIAAGIGVGLPEDLATALAAETVAGAAALAQQTGEAPSQLRENVTSPGGTTAAALDVLTKKDAFQKLLAHAIEAETTRGQELASAE